MYFGKVSLVKEAQAGLIRHQLVDNWLADS